MTEPRPTIEIKVNPETTYNKAALARALGCTERAIEKWRKNRRVSFPRPFYIGARPFWRGHAVLNWMDRQQAESNGQ